jgi:FlaA1/EpsC-like NDP-sugar epimerase
MKREKLLITGGHGFVGTRLASAFENTYDVVMMSTGRETPPISEQPVRWSAVCADITNLESVRRTFEETRPDLVIHTAAMKSVSQSEKEPLHCADLNVVGSQNIARAAMEKGCRVVVGLSSTRAAPPTVDTYGLTKAIMERMFCSLDGKTDTRFVVVRLGNIAWSPGSVLPIWQRMLDESGVIETTGPSMRRFFMNLEDAVDLIRAAVERVTEFHGQVLARHVKQAQVKDVLLRFVALNGGSWQEVERRLGDKEDEILVGDLELPYCTRITSESMTHYRLHFNKKTQAPMSREVSTQTAEALTQAEIDYMVLQQSLAARGAQ